MSRAQIDALAPKALSESLLSLQPDMLEFTLGVVRLQANAHGQELQHILELRNAYETSRGRTQLLLKCGDRFAGSGKGLASIELAQDYYQKAHQEAQEMERFLKELRELSRQGAAPSSQRLV